MTHHRAFIRKVQTRAALYGGIAVILSVLTTGYASAFGAGSVSTHDQDANRKLANTEAKVEQVLTEGEKQTQILEKQLSAHGEAGSGLSLINSPAWEGIGSQSEFYANMTKFGFDMCAINLCQVGTNPIGTTDIEEARDWANKTFFSSVHLDDDDAHDLKEVRRRAAAYTASNGFAISTVIHNELAAGGGSAQALEEIVDSSASARGDIQANSMVALAQYKVAVQQLAVLSAILDVQATQAILEADLHHEEGGDEVPDAYLEADYGDDGTRRSYTMPDKRSSN